MCFLNSADNNDLDGRSGSPGEDGNTVILMGRLPVSQLTTGSFRSLISRLLSLFKGLV